MKNKNEWILTDDDSCQHVRKVDENTFELIEMCLIRHDPDLYEVYADTINVTYYPEAETEILPAFGYSSIGDVQAQYGNEANQIIAECIFENYGTFLLDPLITGVTRDEAERFIKNYVCPKHKYTFQITETYQKEIVIEAISPEEAEDWLEEAYRETGEVSLDDDFSGYYISGDIDYQHPATEYDINTFDIYSVTRDEED